MPAFRSSLIVVTNGDGRGRLSRASSPRNSFTCSSLGMLMSEKQRAYKYGMTLLCIGAFFNWLGINEENAEALRFIGFTCLTSGALLVCLAICMWAHSSRPRSPHVVTGLNNNGDEISVSIHEEKPPDYDSVATQTPPPTYDDAIRLNPLLLQRFKESEIGGESSSEYSSNSPSGSRFQRRDASCTTVPSSDGEPSPSFSRWFTQTILRRTISLQDAPVAKPQMQRSTSQEIKPS